MILKVIGNTSAPFCSTDADFWEEELKTTLFKLTMYILPWHNSLLNIMHEIMEGGRYPAHQVTVNKRNLLELVPYFISSRVNTQ